MKRLLLALLALCAAGGLWWARTQDTDASTAQAAYRTAQAERGTIVAQVTTSGALAPVTTVIVGSQLSGQIIEIMVDYNSEVKTGQVLARLNSDQIRARLEGARADLAQARAARSVLDAQIERSKADSLKAAAVASDMRAQLEKSETQLADAEKTLARQSDLGAHGYVAAATLQTARTQRDTLKAQRQSALAQIDSAKAQIIALEADQKMIQAQMLSADAQVLQRAAVVRQIEVDLGNTDIRSPVDGVVVQRNVELGQPVAASLQAPTLFLVAQDLRRIQIQANVDEADVGRVREGQTVSFTVNAYPGRNFEGTVRQVRLGSQTVQNVVIYTTVIEVDNANLDLKPGMTANLRIVTERRDNVVRVPNAALRWRPPLTASEPAGSVASRPVAPAGAEGDDSPAGPFAGMGGASGGRGRGGGPGLFVERLKAELSLNDDQKAAVDKIVADLPATGRGGGSGRAQGSAGPGGAAQGGGAAGRNAMIEKISAILTEEQRTRLQEMAQAGRSGRQGRRDEARQAVVTGRVYVLSEKGEPVSQTVRLGASDGAFTEILSGLAAGATVILGGGPAGAAKPAGGFRFGI